MRWNLMKFDHSLGWLSAASSLVLFLVTGRFPHRVVSQAGPACSASYLHWAVCNASYLDRVLSPESPICIASCLQRLGSALADALRCQRSEGSGVCSAHARSGCWLPSGLWAEAVPTGPADLNRVHSFTLDLYCGFIRLFVEPCVVSLPILSLWGSRGAPQVDPPTGGEEPSG